MEKPKILWVLALLLVYLDLTLAASCGTSAWESYPGVTCSQVWANNVEIYRDVMPNKDYRLFCCDEDHPNIPEKTKGALSCMTTPCSATPSALNCPTRIVTMDQGKSNSYDEILREKCTTKGGEDGYTSLCCPKNSLEGQLAATYGAEPNEFPHIVKLKLPGHCGGTIYNKRFIITASHCIVTDNKPNPIGEMKVIIGVNSGDNEDPKHVYKVEEARPHENYSKLYPNSITKGEFTYYDIALLKLDRDIEFGENVKALQIAEPGFEPSDYADQAIIAGWGTTDTMETSIHLQKTNVLLRETDKCFEKNPTTGKWGPWADRKHNKDQALCVGGIMEEKWSPTAGTGDSGGPAICRGPTGQAILCGVTSYGGDDKKCLEHNNAEHCLPSIYVRVNLFNDWIKKWAGEPAHANNTYKPYLYGQPVSEGMYDHQVHITSATGKSCGGTLVSQDVVITAASCIVQDDGTLHSGMKVHYGSHDLAKGDGTESYDVAQASYLEGFELIGEKVNVSSQGNRIRVTDDLYKNNLAAIKIKGKAPISDDQLPELPREGKIFTEGREIAFPRKVDGKFRHGGELALRDFHILDKDECQKRMTRVAKGDEKLGAGAKVDGDFLCGVEKYSGGSLCDRELGGGLICTGDNGKDVLCGVQVFRLCEWSIPNVFMDISQKSGWVEDAMKNL